jgi:hypothetical protein
LIQLFAGKLLLGRSRGIFGRRGGLGSGGGFGLLTLFGLAAFAHQLPRQIIGPAL